MSLLHELRVWWFVGFPFEKALLILLIGLNSPLSRPKRICLLEINSRPFFVVKDQFWGFLMP
jgi:hypothetical protein